MRRFCAAWTQLCFDGDEDFHVTEATHLTDDDFEERERMQTEVLANLRRGC